MLLVYCTVNVQVLVHVCVRTAQLCIHVHVPFGTTFVLLYALHFVICDRTVNQGLVHVVPSIE